MLILEVKGKDDQQNKTKREYLDEWIKAVNSDSTCASKDAWHIALFDFF